MRASARADTGCSVERVNGAWQMGQRAPPAPSSTCRICSTAPLRSRARTSGLRWLCGMPSMPHGRACDALGGLHVGVSRTRACDTRGTEQPPMRTGVAEAHLVCCEPADDVLAWQHNWRPNAEGVTHQNYPIHGTPSRHLNGHCCAPAAFCVCAASEPGTPAFESVDSHLTVPRVAARNAPSIHAVVLDTSGRAGGALPWPLQPEPQPTVPE